MDKSTTVSDKWQIHWRTVFPAFTKPPFVCSNEGWGEFEIGVDCYTTEKTKCNPIIQEQCMIMKSFITPTNMKLMFSVFFEDLKCLSNTWKYQNIASPSVCLPQNSSSWKLQNIILNMTLTYMNLYLKTIRIIKSNKKWIHILINFESDTKRQSFQTNRFTITNYHSQYISILASQSQIHTEKKEHDPNFTI